MKVTHPSPPAHIRARRSARVGLAGAAVIGLGLAMVIAGVQEGAWLMLAAFIAAFPAMSHHLAMTELRDAGPVPLELIATPASVLPPHMDADELMIVLASRPSVEQHLVRTAEGWQNVSSRTLMEQARVSDGVVEVHELGRPASWAPADLTVNRLPRPPYAGELIVVGESAHPRVISHDSLLLPAEVRSAAAQADDLSVEHDLDGISREVTA